MIRSESARQYVCPTCRTKFYRAKGDVGPPFPFCSQRCRDADLFQWFAEGYSVPVESERVLQDSDFEEGSNDFYDEPY